MRPARASGWGWASPGVAQHSGAEGTTSKVLSRSASLCIEQAVGGLPQGAPVSTTHT